MFPQNYQLLIVSADPGLRRILRAPLTASGLVPAEVSTREEMLQAVRQSPIDLVLLDRNLAGNGLEACRQIRALLPKIGIVMISDKEGQDDVLAFDAGADDLVVAPFRFREMVARVASVLRRRAKPVAKPGVMRAGNIEVDVERRLLWRGGEKVHLSPKEFDLLVVLMKNQGTMLPHVQLLRAVWGPESGDNVLYLRSYVKALRKKIEENPANPEYILTEPLVGYMFRDPYGARTGSTAPALDTQ